MFQKISLPMRLRKSEFLQTGTFPAVRSSTSLEDSAQIPAGVGCPGEEGATPLSLLFLVQYHPAQSPDE